MWGGGAIYLLNLGHVIFMTYVPNQNYFLYVFPLYRLIQFTIGAIFGRLVARQPAPGMEMSDRKHTLLKAGVITVWIAMIFLCNWAFNGAMFFTVTLGIIVFLSRLPNTRRRFAVTPVIQFLSSISFEFYLIHHVVIRCYDFCGAFPKALYNIHWVVNVLYILVASIVLSWSYQTCTRFLKSIRHKRTA